MFGFGFPTLPGLWDGSGFRPFFRPAFDFSRFPLSGNHPSALDRIPVHVSQPSHLVLARPYYCLSFNLTLQ